MKKKYTHFLHRFFALALGLVIAGLSAGCGSGLADAVKDTVSEAVEVISELKKESDEKAPSSEEKEAAKPAEPTEAPKEETKPGDKPAMLTPEENTESSASLLAAAPVWEGGPSTHGRLSVDHGVLKDEKGIEFQLRGMSTHGIGWFPSYINAGAMESIRNAGGNVFRVAMYTQADSGYLYDPERNMRLVRMAIENARAMDMYVIVDWHILDDGDPTAHLSEAITFFDAVASRYRDDPAILYELCNEPNNVDWEPIKRYAEAVSPVIRQYSPGAVLILGTPDYSSRLSAPMNEPAAIENLMYSFHFYAGEHPNFDALRSAVDAGLPVMVSEWGIGRNGSGGPALDEGKAFLDYLHEKNLSWCAWSLCNKDEVYSVLRPDCDKLARWTEDDLTDVGKLIFSAMR